MINKCESRNWNFPLTLTLEGAISMNIYSIYRATNIINGKIYIGFSKDVPARIICHRHSYKRQNSKFYNAIKKYGWESFIWEIIYQSYDEDYCLNVIEPLIISEYNSVKNGYNTSIGGDRGPKLFGSDNGMFGKTHTEQVKNATAQRSIDNLKGKTYEDIYGVNRAKEIRDSRSRELSNYLANNPEVRIGNKNPNSKKYKITDPNGTIHIVEGSLRKFCKDHNLQIWKIINLVKKRISSYNDWMAEYY